VAIYQFLVSIAKEKKNWVLVLKILPGGVFWPCVLQENYSWPEERKSWTILAFVVERAALNNVRINVDYLHHYNVC
jgi:hypothetical protein